MRQRRRRTHLAVVLTLLASAFGLFSPFYGTVPAAHAQGAGTALIVDEQSASPNFPDTIDFTLKAHGPEVSGAELDYTLAGDPVTSGMSAQVDQPTDSPELKVTLDLSTNYIPPGAEVTYYWLLTRAGLDPIYTPKKKFIMPDTQHTWESLSDAKGRVSVHWYDGEQDFGKSILDTASSALDRLQHNIGAGLERPADIWVYASQDDLLSALPKDVPEWTGGRAFPELALVLAEIPNDENANDEIKRVVPHELSHLVLYEATHNPYNEPPAWMDEGLAVFNQEVQDPAEEAAVEQAVRDGNLMPLKALSGSFGATDEEAILSYGESHSAVDFIMKDSRYGPEKFSRTVAAFHEGVTYDDAMKAGLGVTVDELNSQWEEYLQKTLPQEASTRADGSQRQIDATLAAVLVAVGLCAGLLIAGVTFAIFMLVRRRTAA